MITKKMCGYITKKFAVFYCFMLIISIELDEKSRIRIRNNDVQNYNDVQN